MLELAILDYDTPPLDYDAPANLQPAASNLTIVNGIWHSETSDDYPLVGRLVARPALDSHIQELTAQTIDLSMSDLAGTLATGIFRHTKRKTYYYLNELAYWPSRNELGVWYTTMYFPGMNRGPHWFRPLHGQKDGKAYGWLDPTGNNMPRFERIN